MAYNKTMSTGIRIIAGEFKGRKLSVPDEKGLRPTGARIRTTLFDWLAPHIRDTRCLDLFAGSGALGFEALSRGAASVNFIDNNAAAIRHLQKTADAFHCVDRVHIIQAKMPGILKTTAPFDIVFLDPPFAENLLSETLHFLIYKHYLAQNALVYVEMDKRQEVLFPTVLEKIKESSAGEVKFGLWKFNH